MITSGGVNVGNEPTEMKYGTLILLLAYDKDGDIAGHGYAIFHEGHIHGPFLSNPFGKSLPEAWYTIEPVSHHTTMWNDTVN